MSYIKNKFGAEIEFVMDKVMEAKDIVKTAQELSQSDPMKNVEWGSPAGGSAQEDLSKDVSNMAGGHPIKSVLTPTTPQPGEDVAFDEDYEVGPSALEYNPEQEWKAQTPKSLLPTSPTVPTAPGTPEVKPNTMMAAPPAAPYEPPTSGGFKAPPLPGSPPASGVGSGAGYYAPTTSSQIINSIYKIANYLGTVGDTRSELIADQLLKSVINDFSKKKVAQVINDQLAFKDVEPGLDKFQKELSAFLVRNLGNHPDKAVVFSVPTKAMDQLYWSMPELLHDYGEGASNEVQPENKEDKELVNKINTFLQNNKQYILNMFKQHANLTYFSMGNYPVELAAYLYNYKV